MTPYKYTPPTDLADAELRLGALAADIELIRVQLSGDYDDCDDLDEYGKKISHRAWKDWHKKAQFAMSAKRAEVAQISAWVRAEQIRQKERNRAEFAQNIARGQEVRRMKEERLTAMQRVLESDAANDCVYRLWQAARDAMHGDPSALSWEVVDPVNDWLRSRGYLPAES
jgi:hypothetical protein